MNRLSMACCYIGLALISASCGFAGYLGTEVPGLTLLTKSPTDYSRPVWSPTGNEIAVSTFSYPSIGSGIFVLDAVTGEARRLIAVNGRISAEAWSPDGKHLIFASLGSDRFQEGMWIVGLDGRNARYIGDGDSAAWSPSGEQIAVLSCQQSAAGNDTSPAVRIVSSTGTKVDLIVGTEPCFSNFHISWSPNGQRIVYSYARQPSMDNPSDQINVLDLASKQIEPLSGGEGWSPEWNADSVWIAFVKPGAEVLASSLTVYNTELGCEKPLAIPGLASIGEIAWSRDGSRLAIATRGSIYVADMRSLVGSNGFSCP